MPVGVYVRTKRTRESLSEAAKLRYRNRPQDRRASSKRMRKLWKDPRFVEKHAKRSSRIMKKLHMDPGFVAKLHRASSKVQRKIMLDKWKRKDFVDKMQNRFSGSPSRFQVIAFMFMKALGVKGLVLEYPIQKYSIDIADPERKIAIECDGRYWHNQSRFPGAKRRKRIKTKLLRKEGWKVFSFDDTVKGLAKFLRRNLEKVLLI